MKIHDLYESTKYISSHIEGDIAVLDAMIIPPEHRHKGLGRKVYHEWESKLPSNITFVELVPIISDGINSDSFWYKMGFSDLYFEDDDPDVEVPTVLRKGINGHKVVRQEYGFSDDFDDV